jgi:hypothetical protein
MSSQILYVNLCSLALTFMEVEELMFTKGLVISTTVPECGDKHTHTHIDRY